MSILMTLRVAFKALGRNKLRTALTMLGMIIGVVVGVKEGVGAYGRYRSAFDACVAGRTMPPGDSESASVEWRDAAVMPSDADW